MDSSISFEVISELQNLARSSNGALSIILSIHQPNSRIIDLFDHILLIEAGISTFFGTTSEMSQYFSKIGFPCPPAVTPTDYFLQLTDGNFSDVQGFDFFQAFKTSDDASRLDEVLADVMTLAETKKDLEHVEPKYANVSSLRRIITLMSREITIAYRDPTLYYLQIFLILGFSFFIGAVFFQLPRTVEHFGFVAAALLWMSIIFCWIQVFKVFHLSRNDKRTKHEMSNNKYSAFDIVLADSLTTAIMTILFIPAVPIMYFMMGFPAIAFPFCILNCWMVSVL